MITYAALTKDRIALIKPLWEALNRLHLESSADFKDHFRSRTFERRIEKFKALPDDRLFVQTAEDSGVIIGYVAATVSGDGTGQVDSIYVDGQYRACGVGSQLFKRALAWLAVKECPQVHVVVAEGNEQAFGFYRRFGFYPRMTILARKGEGDRGGP